MISSVPSPVYRFAESAKTISDGMAENVPMLVNGAICVDSLCTVGRSSINFYYSPSPVAKVFFGASCVCGVLGAASSGTALVTSFMGIPVAGWMGALGARGFNRLGKYALHMGNLTSLNITNSTAIADLMS